jgi:hypothetical protein
MVDRTAEKVDAVMQSERPEHKKIGIRQEMVVVVVDEQ